MRFLFALALSLPQISWAGPQQDAAKVQSVFQNPQKVSPAALVLKQETPKEKPLREFRGIIHCHSKYSHDSKGTYEEILAAAKAAKVDFICITDHPPKGDGAISLREGWKGLHDDVLFIQGHELAGKNLLGLGLTESAAGDTPEEKIASIHKQGGIAIISHPEEVTDWDAFKTADAMEIFNVHAAFKNGMKEPGFLAKALTMNKNDPENSFSLIQQLDTKVLEKWDEINKTRRLPGIAGNDSHQNVRIGIVQLDPYPRAFKFVTTHVFAEELTQEAILKAIKEGRVAVVFERMNEDSPFAQGAKLPGAKEYETVIQKIPGKERQEWWILRPEGKRPWALSNWQDAKPLPRR